MKIVLLIIPLIITGIILYDSSRRGPVPLWLYLLFAVTLFFPLAALPISVLVIPIYLMIRGKKFQTEPKGQIQNPQLCPKCGSECGEHEKKCHACGNSFIL